MQFTKIGDLHIVTRVSGPQHLFLSVALSTTGAPAALVLERGDLETGAVTIETADARSDRRREVLEAVSEANRRLGTEFKVTKVRYCSDDAALPGIYGRLARTLMQHVARERDSLYLQGCSVTVSGDANPPA